MKIAQTLSMMAAVDRMANQPSRWRTVCVDFDGVLAESTGPYSYGHIGPAKLEGLKLLRMLKDARFDVVILTARKETDLVAGWLKENGFPGLMVTNHKLPAIAYIDDHAINSPENMKAVEMMKKVNSAR